MDRPIPTQSLFRAGEGTVRLSLRQHVGEIGALAIFTVELAVSFRRMSVSIEGLRDLVLLAPAAFLGVLLTDFISGVIHWLCDAFGDETTPILGPLLIAPFREHHRAPLAITRCSMVHVNHSNCVGIVVVFGVSLWLTRAVSGHANSLFGQAFLAFFAFAVYLTNAIHRWAHQPRPPVVALWLQRVRLAIAPSHHARHHLDGRGTYCITTGWLNPVLDRSKVFDWLEHPGLRLRRVRSVRRRKSAIDLPFAETS